VNDLGPRFLSKPEEPGDGLGAGPEEAGNEASAGAVAEDEAGQMALLFDAQDERRPRPRRTGKRTERAALPNLDFAMPAPPLLDPVAPQPTAELAPPEATAGERIMRFAYGLGMPANTLVAPFRRPPKPRVKAVVESPLAGDRVAGMALRAGHFLIGGAKIPIAEADFSPAAKLPPLVEVTFHGFAWLRDLAASAPAPQCTDTAERVLAHWLAANPHTGPEATGLVGKGAAWSVENAARRLIAWLVNAPLILSGSDKAFRAEVLEAIGVTARWLDRQAAKAEDSQGEALGWTALTAAGLLLPEGKPRRLYAEAGLVRALGEMVGEEGGVLSRSPLVQIEAIAMLIDLSACYRATRREPPQAIGVMLQMLVSPLMALTHADGTLGNWQGSGAIPPARLEALLDASGVRVRPLREPRQWGYHRIAAAEAVLVCDAAPPPLARHARSGCASTLAFEFSHGDQALIVNCGGAALVGGQLPARIEQGLRATAAHSTMVLGDANSTAVLIGGKLGKGVSAVEVDRSPASLDPGAHGKSGSATRLAMSHDGYAARFGLLHRRALMLADDGTVLAGEDRLEPPGRKGGRGKIGYALRFHLAPHVDLRMAADGSAADLILPDGSFWRFAAGGETIAAEESLWVDGDGCPHEAQQLVIEGLGSRGGCTFAWVLRKMG